MKNNLIIVCLGILFFYNISSAQVVTPYEAYSLALEKSNRLKSMSYQLKSKDEALNQYYARLYPTVSASINYNDSRYEINELQVRNNYDVTEVSLDYMISLRQTIFDWELFSVINVENKKVDLYKINYDVEAQKLADEVLKLYLEVFKTKNKIQVLESYNKYSQHKLKLMEKKLSMNLTNKMDFLEAKVDFEKNKIELTKEKKIYNVNLLKLKNLIQIDELELPSIKLTSFSKNIDSILKSFKFDKNDIENSLDLNKSRLELEISKMEVDNAFSAHYPKLTFDARYTLYESNDSTTDYENYGKMMLNLEIPLYQGGMIFSRVKEKKLMYSSALENFEATKKKANEDYEQVNSEFVSSLDSMKVYNDALISANTYLESVELGYKNGLKSVIDLFEAKTEVYKIESEYLTNIQNFIGSYVNMLILTNRLDKISQIDKMLL